MLLQEFEFPQGFHGLIVQHPDLGHLHGYVGVPPEHPFYELQYRQCALGCSGRWTSLSEIWEEIYRLNPEFGPPPALAPGGSFQVWDCISEQGHVCPDRVLVVHGGVTYSDRNIEGMRPGLWYFGFDAAHFGDLVPGYPFTKGDVYRDQGYVAGEVEQLYQQLRDFVLEPSLKEHFRF